MIAVKELSIRTRWLQGRRIACGYCRSPYTILAEGKKTLATHGIPLINSDDAMRKALLKTAYRVLVKEDGLRGWEVGLCPHCHRYQKGMVGRSRMRKLAVWGGLPLVIFWVLAGLPPAITPASMLILPLGAGLVGAGIGWMVSLPEGVRKGKVDPAAIADEDLRRLLVHARGVEGDPLIEWYLNIHEVLPEKELLLTMGFRDYAGKGPLPGDLHSEVVLERLAREAGIDG